MAIHTIENQFQSTGGRPSGFDYLRISLSVLVIAYHTLLACYGKAPDVLLWRDGMPLRPLYDFLIPSFFALSGFLVSGSLFRNTIPGFLTLRALRIFPALFCEIFISALLIGPMVTSFSWKEYFTDSQFYTYFLNILGDIHYKLPGVFLTNPFSNVNQQLWTIPYEMECYIILAFLALIGAIRKSRLFVLLFCIGTAFIYLYTAVWRGFDPEQWGPTGHVCVLAFLGGVMLYILRKKIPYNLPMLFGAIALSWILLGSVRTEYLAAFPVAYVTIWLGLQNPRKIFLIAGADYSYGMYLYGFPVQQLVAYLLPQYRYWYVNLVLSLIISAVFAYLSWNLVEARVMNLKKPAVALANTVFPKVQTSLTSFLPAMVQNAWTALLGLGDKVDRLLRQLEKSIFGKQGAAS